MLTDFVNTYDVVITTYEMVKAQSMKHILVNSIYWRYVVLDEGHVIRHEETQIASVVRHLHYEQVLLITGTPIQNNLHELYSLLNFLQPDVFQSSERFDDCFDIKVANKHRVDKELLMKVHHLLKPFMLRRIKSEVEKSVPPKVEKKILCPLTSTQTFWYKRFLLKNSNLLAELEEQHRDKDSTEDETEGERSRWKRLLSLYMQLRKVCNHPFLFSEADPDPGFTDERIIEASGKLTMMDRLLRKLQKAGHRVVIFSQFTAVLDIIGDYLDYRGFEFSRLDGSTNRVQRQVRINSFNAKNSPVFAFIMSTRAGGLGVNLQTADTVVRRDYFKLYIL